MKTKVLAAVLLALAGTVAVPAAPAAAVPPTERFCIETHSPDRLGGERFCFDIPVVVYPEECCEEIDLRLVVEIAEPADRQRFVEEIGAGVELLVQAQVEDEPRLRPAAVDRFAEAVHGLGGPNVRFDNEGPQPDPWLEAAGTSLADGLNLTWESTAGPGPEPWLEQALAAFDRAIYALRYKEA